MHEGGGRGEGEGEGGGEREREDGDRKGKGEGGRDAGGEGKGGRKYWSPYTVTVCKNAQVCLVATDHSISPYQQFFSRKPPSNFSPSAPLCHTWPSTLQLWTAILRTPAQTSQPEERK